MNREVNRLCKAMTIAAADHHAHIRCGRDPRFSAETDNNQKRLHMPQITDVALLAIKFR